METFKINGVEYTSRPRKPFNSMMSKALGMALVMQGMVGSSRNRVEIPRLDIVKEYELIMQWKSKLSRREREWVKSQFHKRYVVSPK